MLQIKQIKISQDKTRKALNLSDACKDFLHKCKYIYIAISFLLLSSPAFAVTYTVADGMVGEITHYTVKEEDTLYAIARRFDLGIVELMVANPGLDPWVPPEGTELSLPTSYILPKVKRQGIVINLPELRVFYFKDKNTVMTFPVGIGREGWQTPLGETEISLKRKNPYWIPPASIRELKPDLPKVVPAGPDNPLGRYAMNLGWQNYAIHGTNKPYGIGLRSSHGCLRMYPEDIEVLFNSVEKGTKVTVVDMPYKIGWLNNTLYLEVNPTQEQADAIFFGEEAKTVISSEIYNAIEKIAGADSHVDWPTVEEAMVRRNGMPTAIAIKAEQNTAIQN